MIIRRQRPEGTSTNRGLTVLLVESDPVCTYQLVDELASLGHEVVGPVMAGRDGMAVREERPIDFALVDVHLPDGPTGIDVGRYLGVHGIPYAFFTENPETLPSDLAGAVGAIGKPCVTSKLRDALKYLCHIAHDASDGRNAPSSVFLPLSPHARRHASRINGGRPS